MHELNFVITLAIALSAAVFLGAFAHKLGLSPIVGYLFAGILISLATPIYKGDRQIASQLAEVGVILLLFGVGLKFHLQDLYKVWNISVPGALLQGTISVLAAMGAFSLLGVSVKAAVILGIALAVSSTVVVTRVLSDRRALNTIPGRIAIGWLIVQDILTVMVLVLIPLLEEEGPDATAIGFSFALGFLRLAGVVALIVLAGSRVVPWLLVHIARLRNRELFTLSILAICLAIATVTAVFFGASVALGAFLAGMIVGQSSASQQAGADILPMRDAFAVLFFVAVGMLFDAQIFTTNLGMLLAGLGIVLLVNPLGALLAVSLLGHPHRTGLTVALLLTQIGEFSFILSDLARRQGILPPMAHNLLVAIALITMALNPLLFRLLPVLDELLARSPTLNKLLNARFERKKARASATLPLSDVPSLGMPFAIIVGYGPVGYAVDRLLREADIDTLIVDFNIDTVQGITRFGRRALYGDGANLEILKQAGIARASHLVLTLPHSIDRTRVVEAARSLNPKLRIVVRARYLRERPSLEQARVNAAVFEEAEAAIALVRAVLCEIGADSDTVQREMERVRNELAGETEPLTAIPSPLQVEGSPKRGDGQG